MAAEGIDRSVAAAGSCCASACGIHGHAHARPRAASLPVQDGDLAGFWGAVGCGCWAV